MAFTLLFRESKLCPVTLLQLDLTNPRLQTGTDIAVKDDSELIAVLCDIAALDELAACRTFIEITRHSGHAI